MEMLGNLNIVNMVVIFDPIMLVEHPLLFVSYSMLNMHSLILRALVYTCSLIPRKYIWKNGQNTHREREREKRFLRFFPEAVAQSCFVKKVFLRIS